MTYTFDKKFKKVQREGINYFSFQCVDGIPIKYNTQFQFKIALIKRDSIVYTIDEIKKYIPEIKNQAEN